MVGYLLYSKKGKRKSKSCKIKEGDLEQRLHDEFWFPPLRENHKCCQSKYSHETFIFRGVLSKMLLLPHLYHISNRNETHMC